MIPSTDSIYALIPVIVLILITWRGLANHVRSGPLPVLLFVLGDIGRSPRMQYHARSLIQNGFHVHFVGYGGSSPLTALTSSPLCSFYTIPTPAKIPNTSNRIVYLARAVSRVLLQMFMLLHIILFKVPTPHRILVQNPPSVPSLLILLFLRLVSPSAKLIIDWHNFGYSLMALNLGTNSRIVQMARWYEKHLGRFADAHLCVTNAMKLFLVNGWKFPAKSISVLYDRPPEHFRKSSVLECHELLSKYPFGVDTRPEKPMQCLNSTLLTLQTSHIVSPRFYDQRPALLVSSTSWTEDEDFSILLDALVKYNNHFAPNLNLPDIVLIITGKGPLKSFYEENIKLLDMEKVKIYTAWLEIEDYPLLLGSADLGISLHSSSSGLDLPMKIVDMFGCGLPVCALDYPTLAELVQNDVNGCTFKTSDDLFKHLQSLLKDFNESQPNGKLHQLVKGVKNFQKERWMSNWNVHAKPLFTT